MQVVGCCYFYILIILHGIIMKKKTSLILHDFMLRTQTTLLLPSRVILVYTAPRKDVYHFAAVDSMDFVFAKIQRHITHTSWANQITWYLSRGQHGPVTAWFMSARPATSHLFQKHVRCWERVYIIAMELLLLRLHLCSIIKSFC